MHYIYQSPIFMTIKCAILWNCAKYEDKMFSTLWNLRMIDVCPRRILEICGNGAPLNSESPCPMGGGRSNTSDKRNFPPATFVREDSLMEAERRRNLWYWIYISRPNPQSSAFSYIPGFRGSIQPVPQWGRVAGAETGPPILRVQYLVGIF